MIDSDKDKNVQKLNFTSNLDLMVDIISISNQS